MGNEIKRNNLDQVLSGESDVDIISRCVDLSRGPRMS